METIQIDYDPEKVTYFELLQVFLTGHNPARSSSIRQYASAVFYHDEWQEQLAREAIEGASRIMGEKVTTELLPYSGFTRAEDYHQKYYLRSTRTLLDQFEKRFPSEDAFTDSTAAARINGYIGGNGTIEQLEREKDLLGISKEAVETLRGVLRRSGK